MTVVVGVGHDDEPEQVGHVEFGVAFAVAGERGEHVSLLRPVIDGGKEVTITVRGEPRARIVPVPTAADRKALMELLRQIGPLDLPSRK